MFAILVNGTAKLSALDFGGDLGGGLKHKKANRHYSLNGETPATTTQ